MIDWNPETVERQIGINFKHSEVLFTALSDISYAKQIEDLTASNERLAFLGEAVLKLTIANYLYQACPYLQVNN
ncbi:MAG: ribonuclease III, partial [Kamptonema sp. SIO4C4]|nr:ribonuclease III [Kamptonema sp. SIO4C4]